MLCLLVIMNEDKAAAFLKFNSLGFGAGALRGVERSGLARVAANPELN